MSAKNKASRGADDERRREGGKAEGRPEGSVGGRGRGAGCGGKVSRGRGSKKSCVFVKPTLTKIPLVINSSILFIRILLVASIRHILILLVVLHKRVFFYNSNFLLPIYLT